MKLSDFWNHVAKGAPDACWNWQKCKTRDGYGRVVLDGKGRLAHRVAYELTKGTIPSGMLICHSCDNPGCCNPAHLWPGTIRDNNIDMFRKGRGVNPKGERHYLTKLTNDDVLAIRAAHAHGETQASISRRYQVSANCIWTIVNYKRWQHLSEEREHGASGGELVNGQVA